MNRDKQSSKHAFGAWSDPTNKFVGGQIAIHRSVTLGQLPGDSSLAGNGSSVCSSRFSSSSSLLVLALRLTAVSGGSLAQLPYAVHAATPALRPRLSFRTLLHAGIVLELELIQTQMAQKPMLRAEVGMRVRCANKASAE